MHPRLPTTPSFFLCWTMLVSITLAQIPRGHVVVSTFRNPGTASGLETFHAYGLSVTTPITGLPPDITGAGLATPAGAACVLVDPATGNVIVGEHAPAGASLDVHHVTLSGTAATVVTSCSLGTVGSGFFGSVDQMAWLGNDILVLNRRGALISGPLAGQTLGLVQLLGPTSGIVVALPLTFVLAGTVNAMAVDAAGANAYVATFVFSGPLATSTIYRIPLVAPHTPVIVGAVPGAVLSLAFDADGLLVAGTGYYPPGSNFLHFMNVATGAIVAAFGSAWPSSPYLLSELNAVTCDAATGDLLLADDLLHVAFRLPRLGFASYGPPVAIATGIVGVASGAAVRPSVSAYGPATPGAFAYEWLTTLLPGGNPAIGNAGFQLAMAPTASLAPTLLGVSTGVPTPTPLPTPFGFTLLLDPLTLVVPAAFVVPPSTIPVPIPGNPALAGQDFFFQTVHLEPAGFAASNGLWLSLF